MTRHWVMLALLLALPPAPAVAADRPDAAATTRRGPAHAAARAPRAPVERIVVGFEPRAGRAARQAALDRAAAAHGLQARSDHAIAGGYVVVTLSRPLDAEAGRAFMARLRQQPGVRYVAVDGRLRAAAVDDPLYPQQWHLQTVPNQNGPTRVDQAWARADGGGVLVAVVDTGITTHPDLAGKIVAGRDFISDAPTAGDGDGRDADPNDEGDWMEADQCGPGSPARDSSWHGTHVAGTIAAVTNNGIGVAGVAPGAMLLPVRALGHCGGWSTDVADAIQWAAGGAVPGVPANPHPAEVINLSLSGEEPCIAPLQSAIDFANAQGAVVVVAAGNSHADAGGFAPANCEGVVVVGATDRWGDRSWFSNTGPRLDLSGPGGGGNNDVLSTWNLGTTTQGAPGYTNFAGTSQATATVSGIAALMQSASPRAPRDVEEVLAGTARRMVLCMDGTCGAGAVDAKSAVDAVLDGALMIHDAEVNEGSRGDALVSVDVRLSKPMPNPVSFDLVAEEGAAPYPAAGTDDFQGFHLVGEVMAPGETLRRYSLRVTGDSEPESDELLRVRLANVQGAATPRPVAHVVIRDDDPRPLANGVAAGPFDSAGYFLHRYFYIDVPPGATSLQLHTQHEGGSLGMAVTPHVLPGLESGDCWGEDWWGESFCQWDNPEAGRWYVMLYSADYIGATLTMSYTAPAPPQVSIGDASTAEGSAGAHPLLLPVTLSAPAPAEVSFVATVEPGTAIAGVDYVDPGPQPFVIPAGETSVQVPVSVLGDTLVEGNESFAVALGQVQGATVSRGRAVGRIANDDLAALSVADVVATESDADTTVRFRVSLSSPMPSPVAFDIRTEGGTAQAGTDFRARSLVGRYLDAGRTQQDFEVVLIGDEAAEATESFKVRVDNVVGAVLADGEATATVLDDDAPQPARPSARAVQRLQRPVRGRGQTR